MLIEIILLKIYNINVVKKDYKINAGQEVDRMEQDEMTNVEFIAFLETLAKLVEATAKTPEEAAQIIRDTIPSK